MKKYAIEHNIKIYNLQDLYNIKNLIFISLEFDRIIKTHLFKTSKLYNMHFSKLPSYRGMHTSSIPILNGENRSGVTLHKIDNGIDTGDIIAQKIFDIKINDTARDLYFKYLKYGFLLFKKYISDILSGKIILKPQSATHTSYYSKKAVDYKNIVINLNKTSFEIHNQIRSFIFQEYQLPSINGIKIIKSKLFEEKIKNNFFKNTKKAIILSGIDGYKIELTKYNN